jgi:hypothetical protein
MIAELLDELENAAAGRARLFRRPPTSQGVEEFRQQIIAANARVRIAREAIEARIKFMTQEGAIEAIRINKFGIRDEIRGDLQRQIFE